MTTVVLLFFQDYIHRAGLYKGAALGATAASLLLALHSYFKLFPLAEYLPFYDYGFGWLIPAIASAACWAGCSPSRTPPARSLDPCSKNSNGAGPLPCGPAPFLR